MNHILFIHFNKSSYNKSDCSKDDCSKTDYEKLVGRKYIVVMQTIIIHLIEEYFILICNSLF